MKKVLKLFTVVGAVCVMGFTFNAVSVSEIEEEYVRGEVPFFSSHEVFHGEKQIIDDQLTQLTRHEFTVFERDEWGKKRIVYKHGDIFEVSFPYDNDIEWSQFLADERADEFCYGLNCRGKS